MFLGVVKYFGGCIPPHQDCAGFEPKSLQQVTSPREKRFTKFCLSLVEGLFIL